MIEDERKAELRAIFENMEELDLPDDEYFRLMNEALGAPLGTAEAMLEADPAYYGIVVFGWDERGKVKEQG